MESGGKRKPAFGNIDKVALIIIDAAKARQESRARRRGRPADMDTGRSESRQQAEPGKRVFALALQDTAGSDGWRDKRQGAWQPRAPLPLMEAGSPVGGGGRSFRTAFTVSSRSFRGSSTPVLA